MLRRVALLSALIALTGCAGMESASRASRASAPAPAASPQSEAPPAMSAAPQPAPVAASPAPEAPAPAPQAPAASASQSNDEEVIVPGARERQVQPPDGDPRSNAERMEDIRAWDRCVMRVQAAGSADPLRPQLVMPEEYCRESLGMANRTAVPQSRLERR